MSRSYRNSPVFWAVGDGRSGRWFKAYSASLLRQAERAWLAKGDFEGEAVPLARERADKWSSGPHEYRMHHFAGCYPVRQSYRTSEAYSQCWWCDPRRGHRWTGK